MSTKKTAGTNIRELTIRGAILGGAIASHMNAGSPLYSHTLFGVWLGLVMWGGLWLRDPALRALFPWRRGG